jgi:hypothetical protein
MAAKPTLFIMAPLVEHLAERHPTFRPFIIADIDPIFVSIIVSCQIRDHRTRRPISSPERPQAASILRPPA